MGFGIFENFQNERSFGFFFFFPKKEAKKTKGFGKRGSPP